MTGRHPPPPLETPPEYAHAHIGDPARLALKLATLGWHILPLSPASKRPLGNCPACRTQHGTAGHLPDACPCLTDGGWCHGVRAATTDPGYDHRLVAARAPRHPRRRRRTLRPCPDRH